MLVMGSPGLFSRRIESGGCSFAPPGLVILFTSSPGLAPLRQAQGKLWAAFLRRFAAGSKDSTLAYELPQQNYSPGRVAEETPSLRRRSRACRASGECG